MSGSSGMWHLLEALVWNVILILGILIGWYVRGLFARIQDESRNTSSRSVAGQTDELVIYVSPRGEKYHYARQCYGLRNAHLGVQRRELCSCCLSAQAF